MKTKLISTLLLTFFFSSVSFADNYSELIANGKHAFCEQVKGFIAAGAKARFREVPLLIRDTASEDESNPAPAIYFKDFDKLSKRDKTLAILAISEGWLMMADLLVLYPKPHAGLLDALKLALDQDRCTKYTAMIEVSNFHERPASAS